MTNAKSGLDAGLFLDEDDDYVVFESGSEGDFHENKD